MTALPLKATVDLLHDQWLDTPMDCVEDGRLETLLDLLPAVWHDDPEVGHIIFDDITHACLAVMLERPTHPELRRLAERVVGFEVGPRWCA